MTFHVLKHNLSTRLMPACSALILAAALCSAGCEATEDDDYNHTPPAGQGSMIVNNDASRNVDVFVDGVLVGDTFDGHWRAFDLPPGVHRVVLQEINGDASFVGDIDILEGRLTILNITASLGFNLAVDVYFQDP